MDEFISLLENFWIIRNDKNSEYHKIKYVVDRDNEMKRFINNFPGWRLIANSKLIKLEKTPAEAEPFMGIQEFQTPLDYCMLCAVLIFLSDKDDGRKFLLSELTEALEKIIAEVKKVDFTKYSDRRSLVRALDFAEKNHLIKISDGSLSGFENDAEKEILYENTGLAVYFSVHHGHDILEYRSYRDFEKAEGIYTDNEKGAARTARVYRRLILQPAMYWDNSDNMDSIYLKNQRASISKYLDNYLGGRLDIHNGSAFYLLNEEAVFGEVHPSDKMLAGMVLLLCNEIRENLTETFTVSNRNIYEIDSGTFYKLILDCRNKYLSGLSKEYREMLDDKLVYTVTEYMKSWKMIECLDEKYLLKDGIFKTAGRFPKDFNLTEDNIDGGTVDNEQDRICELLGV